MTLQYSYYPGCASHSTAKEYDSSIKAISKVFDIILNEIPDWVCCGASPAHSTNELLSEALPAKNMELALSKNLPIATSCAACYSRLRLANHEIKNNLNLKNKLNSELKISYKGELEVKHLLAILYKDVGLENIKAKVKKGLNGLKVASYYGCLLTRPKEPASFDDVENPISMDQLIEAVGGESIKWGYKTECCGASLAISRPDLVIKLANDILSHAKKTGAECIVTACPLCQPNLDLRQKEIREQFNEDYNMPIFYFSQLIGIALDVPKEELLLERLITEPYTLLKSKNLTFHSKNSPSKVFA